MMKQRKALFFSVCAAFLILLAGCASSAGRVSDSITAGNPEDPVSIVVLSYNDVRAQYGPTFLNDPFIAPAGTIMPTANDYIVLKLNFNLPEKAAFMLLRAEVTDDRGKILAGYMTRAKFADFAMQQSPDLADNTLKRNKIDWYYLPNPIMTVDAGKHSYLVVLVGKHPIPDTGTIHVAVSLDNKATTFDLLVPVTND